MSNGRTVLTPEQAAKFPKQFGRQPDFVIGPVEDPYLLRWWVIERNKHEGNHYRHCIIKSDDDRALHDHPWPSVSIVREGVLREILPEGESRILMPGVPYFCLLYTSPSPRDQRGSRMPSSA